MSKVETISDYCQARGGLGVMVVLKSEPHRFVDLEEALHISSSTLTERLGEARDLGLITPEIDEGETSVDRQYRISERGQYVVRKLEQLDVEHAYRTFLDMHHQIEAGRAELLDRLTDEAVKEELARQSEVDPYTDPFGLDALSDDTDRRYK